MSRDDPGLHLQLGLAGEAERVSSGAGSRDTRRDMHGYGANLDPQVCKSAKFWTTLKNPAAIRGGFTR